MDKRQTESLPIEETPEVKSFIYQQMVDFEPFLTAAGTVSVVSKNKYRDQSKSSDKTHHILITIKENGVSIEEEAKSANIYEAIMEAKSKLYKKLISIQDSVLSEQDRLAQIYSMRSGNIVH